MTIYATKQDIIDRYGEDLLLRIADRDNDDTIDDTAVTKALADQADEIDVYLSARCDLPLTTVPGVLKRLNVDMAVYQLAGDEVQEHQQKRYENAVNLLIRISKGEVKLGLPEESQPEESETMAVDAADKLFGRDTLAQY